MGVFSCSNSHQGWHFGVQSVSTPFLGLKVIAATADGASTNQRFFRLHDLSSETMPHTVKNPYASEERHIYFFSDVPQLLKTVRNGLASHKRNLWVCAKCIHNT